MQVMGLNFDEYAAKELLLLTDSITEDKIKENILADNWQVSKTERNTSS
jgi:hypothetical protein